MTSRGLSVLSVLLGVVVGGLIGWGIGTLVGGWATRGCDELECVFIMFWQGVGVLLGAVLGGLSGWLIRRRRVVRASESPHAP